MELALKQVAEIFDVSETRIIDWVKNENLPSDLVADQYRFHRADLLEWAAIRNRSFSPTIYAKVNGDLTFAGTHLTDALEAGGVLQDVGGDDLRAIFDTALDGLPLPESVGKETLVELFLAREQIGSTAIGCRIAVPHPRQPVLLTVPHAVVRLCYLRHPLEMPTPDGKPVDTLFLMVCPTAHEHLQLLARLSALLQVGFVRDALRSRTAGEALFEILREAGQRFHEEERTSGATR